ncbi:MAG TPA: alpha/beta fold hydrolase, partial [Acidimicrobiales bacterium]|nr:alpha/beta fold hydrolase [Acidimicrobiales bacterium]
GAEVVVRSADGAPLWATDAGPRDGTPVVLAHGWTNDRRIWGAVAQRLVDRGHRVVMWDHRGHGRSGTGDDGFSLDALAGDVRAVLEHFDLRGAVLAGHSMGGMAAQAFAALHADAFASRVRAVGLVSTACDGLRGAAPRADTVGPWLIAHPRLERAMASARLGPALMRNTVGKAAALSHLDAMRATFVGTTPDARAGCLTAILGLDLAATLPALDKPAVVLVGSHDRLTPPVHARRLVMLLPDARLEVLPEAGHMLPFERPDHVAEVLDELTAA